MESLPVWDGLTDSDEDREMSLFPSLRGSTATEPSPADGQAIVRDPVVCDDAAVEQRRARHARYRADIAECCNAADDEATLYRIVAEATARWMGAAAVTLGADLRAFAATDLAEEPTIAALFHVALHRLADGTARFHSLREMAIAPEFGDMTVATGYHTLAIAPFPIDGESPGALLAAARGEIPFDGDALATLARAAENLGVAVTRMREMTRLRQEKEALAMAMQRKDDFLASVSHELRTPLTAILGFAHIIVENDGLGAARRRGMAEDIVASGGLLLTQVNDLLDIVQLGAGRLSVPLDMVDVAAAVQWCARAVAPLMKSKGLNFKVSVTHLLPLARANTSRLEQVVLNLLVNAYKFTPLGGTVILNAERALDRITLSVIDTGIGIAPEHLTRIFEPFERIETESNRTQSGAGVGLAVARRLVEMMHGTLAVESTQGVGSIFTVTVPVGAERRTKSDE
jgi:signal transduction histidine kinase